MAVKPLRLPAKAARVSARSGGVDGVRISSRHAPARGRRGEKPKGSVPLRQLPPGSRTFVGHCQAKTLSVATLALRAARVAAKAARVPVKSLRLPARAFRVGGVRRSQCSPSGRGNSARIQVLQCQLTPVEPSLVPLNDVEIVDRDFNNLRESSVVIRDCRAPVASSLSLPELS